MSWLSSGRVERHTRQRMNNEVDIVLKKVSLIKRHATPRRGFENRLSVIETARDIGSAPQLTDSQISAAITTGEYGPHLSVTAS